MDKKYCDWCQIEIEVEAIKIECWYKSDLEEEPFNGQFIFDFCNDKCAYEWVKKNLTNNSKEIKENKNRM